MLLDTMGPPSTPNTTQSHTSIGGAFVKTQNNIISWGQRESILAAFLTDVTKKKCQNKDLFKLGMAYTGSQIEGLVLHGWKHVETGAWEDKHGILIHILTFYLLFQHYIPSHPDPGLSFF